MKNLFNTSWIYIAMMLFAVNLSHGQENKSKTITAASKKADKPDSPQIVEGEVIFSDGTNNLLRITDEGTTGAIQFQDGAPSDVNDKLYNDGGILHFNGTPLGSEGADELNDLTDAKYDGSNSIYIGEGAGHSITGTSNFNTSVGKSALAGGSNNTSIGYYSLLSNTGLSNTSVGALSLWKNTSGNDNVALGSNALYDNESGNDNLAIGAQALSNNISGQQNTIIGSTSGYNTLGDGNVFLGYKSGYNENGSNKLYIENSDSDTPLIWGDFNTDSLKFNGNVHVSGNLTLDGNLFSSINIPLWLTVGNNNASTNIYNILTGKNNLSTAISTASFGENLKTSSFLTTVLGRFNDDDLLYNSETWVATEPLFVIGNGTDDANRANAFLVKKNGNTSINGNLDVNGKAAIGATANASGTNSFAIGSNVNASGNGTIFIGDNSAASVQSATTDNRFTARFSGGYKFYTNSDLSLDYGAILEADQSSWSAISDSTKKENFLPVNGEKVLSKISKFNLRSWNYKGQDPAKFRHYGPMAQEFFNAFGHDGIGTIGNDTTIASADFDGINLIAIQALEKRTREQELRIKQQELLIKKLEERISELENFNKDLLIKNVEYKNQNQNLINEFAQIKQALSRLLKSKDNTLLANN